MPIPRILLCFLLSAPAAASEVPKGCDFSVSPGQDATLACYQDLDRDGDGVLSQTEAEVLPRLRGKFQSLDADGDGLVSPDEFQAGETTPPQRGGAKGA